MLPDMEMEEAPSAGYMYGHPSSDLHIDDLLDFSNEEIFDASSSDVSSSLLPPPDTARPPAGFSDPTPFRPSFSDDLCVPSDDVAELEWLSEFVEDSFSYLPFPGGGNENAGSGSSRPDVSVPGRARSKRSRAPATGSGWIAAAPPHTDSPEMALKAAAELSGKGKSGGRRKETVSGESVVRKCTHCATEKTPQWRTGPMGPKSLCNACGVRYKSGRLVPEYRPAASPTFVLTQHSNSHRKVMELRRQKEILRQESFHDFKVC